MIRVQSWRIVVSQLYGHRRLPTTVPLQMLLGVLDFIFLECKWH